jgi:hypothetical protein
VRIDTITQQEWLKIADTISMYCPSEPLTERLISIINTKTDLFLYTHDFFVKNKFNPIFFPDRPSIEKCKDGKGLMKRLAMYRTKNGNGVYQFKKDYQNYILNKYQITEKQEV